MATPRRIVGRFASLCFCGLALACGSQAAGSDPQATAQAGQILAASGVKGGLVVHVGCGDGRLTAALRASDAFLVHGVDRDPAAVERARRHIESLGLYGPVSADTWDGKRLPYADGLVNLAVVAGSGFQVPEDEVLRVLAPNGVAIFLPAAALNPEPDTRNPAPRILRKPWPDAIDEWTHFLHGADGNAVARDSLVGPPQHVQWMDGPVWARHHDTVPSVNALVSARGRIFYMVDEAPPGIGGEIPDQWALAARDAFNGLLLWKRPVALWGWKAWSGTWKGRFNLPNHVPKRLVAAGDRLYATLGFNAPLSALDAATGKTVRSYPGTEYTDEILFHRDTLILSVNQAPQKPGKVADAPPVKKSILAVDPATGKVLWKTGSYVGTSSKTGTVERVSHLLLAARGSRVFVADAEAIVAIDLVTGKELWKAPRPEHKRYTSRYNHLMSDLCTLVATDGVVLFAQLEPIQKRIGWGVIKTGLYAFATADGALRWSRVVGNWGHFCVPDVFVVGERAWVHDYKTVAMTGLDLLTGEEKARVSTETWFKQGHHHRCYRNKATERYILTGYRGVEFLDLAAATHTPHHWTRGGCRYGILPCNGLLYGTPHPCECYIKAKLNGLYALAPAKEGRGPRVEGRGEEAQRLEKGPAFGAIGNRQSAIGNPNDWPTYRQNPLRSGSTTTPVPAGLTPAWERKLGGALTPPVAAGGRLLVARKDAHQVVCLDAASGAERWRFTAGDRVDSPPTLHEGLALFGCADGWVYALRASDGVLAWRLRAAPEERLVVAFGQLESAWPVHGSVLVQGGAVHFAAGRSSYLDGGIHVYSADVKDGRILSRKCIYSPDPETGLQPPQKGPQELPGALSDILVGSERGVTMRHLRVDADSGKSPGHLVCTAGFLDATWFNRTTWSLGHAAGQLLVFDDGTAYGVQAYADAKRWEFFYPEKGYTLFAADRRAKAQGTGKKAKRPPDRWRLRVPIRVTAMVLAGERLFIAGPPDVVDPDDPWAAFEGRKGSVLWALAASDGQKQAERALPALPVFDGLIAARRRLFLSTRDGRVLCLGGEQQASEKGAIEQ